MRFDSLLFKYAIGYIAIIIICLIFMNIYPVVKMRSMMYESKNTAVQNQASVIASSLSSLEVLTPNEVGKVMSLLGNMSITRVIVADDTAKVVYDSTDNEGNVGKYALLPEIVSALDGNSVFYYKFTFKATNSRAAIPIMFKGKIIGVVYIYEYSTEEAELVYALRSNLMNISTVVFLTAILLAIFISRFLDIRMHSVIGAIKKVAAGEYSYRINVKGHDELDDLADEFNALADRLQRTETLRQRFVSDASHELKTPLAGIRLLTDSIVQNDNMPPELQREFMLDIGMEAERLSRITEKLLRLTKLDVKKEEKLSEVNVKTIINNAMKMLTTLAEKKNVHIECELDDDCIIWSNPDDVHEVVFNLVENAIKYNIDNGSVRVLLFKKNDTANVIIDDTGIGIPEEDIPHIFDRFYRVDKARTSDVGGSGLGLAIVKDTVEKHGGTVTASRREKGGTRFTVVFPLLNGKA